MIRAMPDRKPSKRMPEIVVDAQTPEAAVRMVLGGNVDETEGGGLTAGFELELLAIIEEAEAENERRGR